MTRRKLKRLDTDRLLTAARSQVGWGRPGGAGRHGFTQGDEVGEVAPQKQGVMCSGGVGWGWRCGRGENRTRDKHKRLLFLLVSACVMQAISLPITHDDQAIDKHTLCYMVQQ